MQAGRAAKRKAGAKGGRRAKREKGAAA
jgi:hypothetical protein